jgi:hypothetical protein
MSRVNLSSQTSGYGALDVRIESKRHLTALALACTSSLPPLFTVENLYIAKIRPDERYLRVDTTSILWLELLRPFASVKNLYIYRESVPHVSPALQMLVGERTTEVLPVLQNLFLEELQQGLVQEGIEQFAAARQLSGIPRTVTLWDGDSEKDKL